MIPSNYYPALDKAFEVLNTSLHENCALSLIFLSDGQPPQGKSDSRHHEYEQEMTRWVQVDWLI